MQSLRIPLILIFAVLSLNASAFAASDGIVGVWLNGGKDAHIDISKCGDKYCGKIVWLKEPLYPQRSKAGTPGTPKLDDKNPDASRRNAPLIGLEIVKGLQFAGDDSWKNGTIYDPDSGKTYNSKAKLVSPNELDLRGFIGFSLMGRTEKWTRVQ
jgi:uncharacterized protein (DUF2147 family)